MAPPPPWLILSTVARIVETLTDFLIAAIHTILHARNLLPPSTFIRTRKYNLAVPQQRHPKVCAWIMDACSGVRTQVLAGIARRVIFAIYDEDGEVVERWMFDVDDFPVVPEDVLAEVFHELSVSVVDIEEQLRATMKKLADCKAQLEPLPENCTYAVMVELKKGADPPPGVSFPPRLSIAAPLI